ncbi:MAG: hypothetical protein QOI20_1161, partial [Acidimicrobiaceae bacterium]|nr:hypothetical protein [Acidimicrobiaceae bacterium]
SDYHQDYGDPRCPSGVDEATHECWTMYFTLGLVMTGGRFVPVNPQHGCGPQDNCTYVTSVPCPQTRSDPPEEDLWGAEFYQRIVDHSSVGPIDPRSPTVPGSDDVRSSGHVYLFRCQLRFTGAPTVR